MKLTLALCVALLLFTTTAYSQLTDADLNKIRLVVKEEVEKAVEASEKRMKEHVSQEIGKVNIKVSEMDKRFTDKIASSEKDLSGDIETLGERLNNIFFLTLGLLAFIAVVVGVPQIIVAMQRKDIRTQDEKIEALMQEIETLKQERIVRP